MGLKEARNKKGYSAHKLSLLSNISQSTIESFEGHHRNINTCKLKTLCKLALTLDCSILDLLDDPETIYLFKLSKKGN